MLSFHRCQPLVLVAPRSSPAALRATPRQLLLTAEFLPCCRIPHFPSRDAEMGLASHLEAPARESPPASVDVRGLTAAGLWAVAANPSAGTVLPLTGCLLLLLLWDLVLPLAESPWPGVGCSYCQVICSSLVISWSKS